MLNEDPTDALENFVRAAVGVIGLCDTLSLADLLEMIKDLHGRFLKPPANGM